MLQMHLSLGLCSQTQGIQTKTAREAKSNAEYRKRKR